MTNLSQIFPVNYPNPPSEEELLFEVQDMLRHADSPLDILHTINQIPCPYYRKAIASMTPCHWHDMEHMGKEPAVYIDSEGHGRITWINIDADIRKIIKQANAEQIALEQQSPTIPTTYPITHNPNPTTTMPLFINRHEGTINHNEYHHCTIYQGAPVPQPQAEPQCPETEEIVPAEEQVTPAVVQSDANNQQVLDLLFRADDDDRGRTEILLSAIIKGKKVKTKIVAELHDHRQYFNLQNLSLEDKTKVINAWIDKLGYTDQLNGKRFTIKDW